MQYSTSCFTREKVKKLPKCVLRIPVAGSVLIEDQNRFPFYVFTEFHPVDGSLRCLASYHGYKSELCRWQSVTIFKLNFEKELKMSVIILNGVRTDFLHCWLQFNGLLETDLITKVIRKQVF